MDIKRSEKNKPQFISAAGLCSTIYRRRLLKFSMYKRILKLCSPEKRASGPGIDDEYFFANPCYHKDVIEDLTMVPMKEYSLFVSELMDRLGYSYDMIKHRQCTVDELFTRCNRLGDLKVVITGGKGEGTSLCFESDIDIMAAENAVICADNPHRFIQNENTTLFKTERNETSPGYTRLKLFRLGQKTITENIIRQSLFESESGSKYLSSQFYNDTLVKRLKPHWPIGATSGPSLPTHSGYSDFDHVDCFRCFCPDILDRWVSRHRCYGWPTPDIIKEISLLDGHVVPVGFKGSQNMYREWRICYSLAELHLMRTLNETQLKVYILLKKISKSLLKPVCDEITSYVMKNVVFWMCEANSKEQFTQSVLVDRLVDCIRYLRACVCQNNLPSYMIPERNLLAGRLGIQQKLQLTNILSDLLCEGGRMLLRCDILRDAMLVMYKTPAMFREFGEKRDKIESLLLMFYRMKAEIYRPGMSEEELHQLLSLDEQYLDIVTHTDVLMKFDALALKQIGRSVTEIRDLRMMREVELLS